jgi:hypothetical protein
MYIGKRFPGVLRAAIRYTDDYRDSDSLWDAVFYAPGKSSEELGEEIFSAFGEERLFSALFIPWTASERAFPLCSSITWEAIRRAMHKSRDVLGTRAYFAKRWARNMLRINAVSLHNYGAVKKENTVPIVIAAAGPSLEPCLPLLRAHRDRFFLMALSSALAPLLQSRIIPDLCVSTDGGEWAKRHLSPLQAYPEIPLVCSLESAVPGAVLAQNPIVFLDYGGDLEKALFEIQGFRGIKGTRCGTVAGTAAELALTLTDGPVWFCGLDLAPGKGFHHARPNTLSKDASIRDGRLSPLAHRLASAGFANGALALYRSWFATRTGDFANRVRRLSLEPYAQKLGNIRDLPLEETLKMTEKGQSELLVAVPGVPGGKKPFRSIAENNAIVTLFARQLFPVEVLSAERDLDKEVRTKRLNGLREKAHSFLRAWGVP